jgi:hypothetical protein
MNILETCKSYGIEFGDDYKRAVKLQDEILKLERIRGQAEHPGEETRIHDLALPKLRSKLKDLLDKLK